MFLTERDHFFQDLPWCILKKPLKISPCSMISGLIQKYLKLKSLRFAAEDIPVFDTNSLFLLVKCAVRVQLSV